MGTQLFSYQNNILFLVFSVKLKFLTKKITSISADYFLPGDEGIEPPPKVLETPIIPLDQSPICTCRTRYLYHTYRSFVNVYFMFSYFLKMSTLNSTFFHVFIVLPFCTIRSLFYCIFSLLGSAIVRLPLLPTSHAPYFRSYASCFTSSSNSSPAE